MGPIVIPARRLERDLAHAVVLGERDELTAVQDLHGPQAYRQAAEHDQDQGHCGEFVSPSYEGGKAAVADWSQIVALLALLSMFLGAVALLATGVAGFTAGQSTSQDSPAPPQSKEHKWLASLTGEYTGKVGGALGK